MIKHGATQTQFQPHPFMRNPHVQTVMGAYWNAEMPEYQAVQHHIKLPDGDSVVVHDDLPEQWKPEDRIVLMIHGLGGCHGSNYLVRISDKFRKLGIRSFRLDLRGCGAGAELASRPFHAGCSDDATEVVKYLEDLCPKSPCTSIGFSMGGNIVLKMAGESGHNLPGNLDSAFAVAPPIDLATCCDNMSQGLNRLYDRNFVKALLRHVASRKEANPTMSNLDFEKRPGKIREFDAFFTAPRAGFDSVEDYYTRASSGPLLKSIQVPTNILTSADDPIVPFPIFSTFDLSDNINLQVTDHGGHLGFISSPKHVTDRRWMDTQVINWVQKLGHISTFQTGFSQRTQSIAG